MNVSNCDCILEWNRFHSEKNVENIFCEIDRCVVCGVPVRVLALLTIVVTSAYGVTSFLVDLGSRTFSCRSHFDCLAKFKLNTNSLVNEIELEKYFRRILKHTACSLAYK